MRRVRSEDSFIRWKRRTDDQLTRLQQGRKLGKKQAQSFQIGSVILTADDQEDGSVILYARHVHAPDGSKVVIGVVAP